VANAGATNFPGLAATVPGAGIGYLVGSGTNRFAVQIAYPAATAAVIGSFIIGTSKLAEVTWRDVTADVMSVSWDRGGSLGQRPIAGQLTVELKNPTRTYSPTVSTYFAPGTMIRVVAGDPTLITSVQIMAITQTWDESFTQGTRFVTITALEPQFMLGEVNNLGVSEIGAGENLSSRVDRILAAADFPFARETNYGAALAGTQTFQATALAQESLTELYLTVDSVDGVLFMSKAGKLEICERASVYRSTAYVLGAGGNVNIRLDELTTANDDQILLSQVSLARVGGTALTFSQPGFAARFHAATTSRSDLITQSDADLVGVAAGLLGRGTQTLRPVSATVISDNTAAYNFLMAVDLYNTMNVKDSTFVTFNTYAVCRLSHTITPHGSGAVWWECAVEFEPTATSTRT
jgi:hypothetical protein